MWLAITSASHQKTKISVLLSDPETPLNWKKEMGRVTVRVGTVLFSKLA